MAAQGPRSRDERIALAEAQSARYLGNYNETLATGRAKSAEKLLTKSQHWLDVTNNLHG